MMPQERAQFQAEEALARAAISTPGDREAANTNRETSRELVGTMEATGARIWADLSRGEGLHVDRFGARDNWWCQAADAHHSNAAARFGDAKWSESNRFH